ELCLDMSDFNQSSHDFQRFVEKLRKLDPVKTRNGTLSRRSTNLAHEEQRIQQAIGTTHETLSFEDTLFFVYLPDLNNIRKPCPHQGIRSLFEWLEGKGVKRIITLNMPDSASSPMSDELVEDAIIRRFEIEKLDWRKLDISLDILTPSKDSDWSPQITKLTLYSSGNWSVLYHYLSKDGLARLPEGAHDFEAHRRHLELARSYKTRLEIMLTELREDKELIKKEGLNDRFKLKIVEAAKWTFPLLQYRENEEPFVPKQLQPSTMYLDELAESPNDTDEVLRFQEVTAAPCPGTEDQRIKICIIDNGVDRIRTNVRDLLARGVSFVNTNHDKRGRILPWWLVADPHGTQMASLIGQTNRHCRLYIARVGKGRRDILPENAAKAIKWALEQKVDIISMSWITKHNNPDLKQAVEEAISGTPQTRPTLLFCSTADEGAYSGDIWPAKYDDTVRISATDRYGHTRPASDIDDVNILVPGEDMDADGPSYMEKHVQSTVSGSSVATALAAGIASLALLMIKTFNDVSEEDWKFFHTKEGIMKVFQKMGSNQTATGVRLSTLFPDTDLSTKLPEEWNVQKLKEP
ncbi:subtilisin-like protein, partial [Amniculicola lignicola CBS 123094]